MQQGNKAKAKLLMYLLAGSLLVLEPSNTFTQTIEVHKPLEYKIESPRVFSGTQLKEINCIREALWHEARGESIEGIKSVLTVIINRKKHPDYPGTFCKVIYQPMQFSYLNQKHKSSGSPLGASRSDSEKKVDGVIKELAKDAVEGRFKPSLPAGVLWYHSKTVQPGWTRAMLKVKEVGQHRFYAKKEVKVTKGSKV